MEKYNTVIYCFKGEISLLNTDEYFDHHNEWMAYCKLQECEGHFGTPHRDAFSCGIPVIGGELDLLPFSDGVSKFCALFSSTGVNENHSQVRGSKGITWG